MVGWEFTVWGSCWVLWYGWSWNLGQQSWHNQDYINALRVGWNHPACIGKKRYFYIWSYICMYCITVCSFCPVSFPKSMLFQKQVWSFKPIGGMQTSALGFMVHVLLRSVVVSHVLRFVWTFLVWLYFCWVTVSIPVDIHFGNAARSLKLVALPWFLHWGVWSWPRWTLVGIPPFPRWGVTEKKNTVAWSNTHLNTNYFSSCDPWTYTHLLTGK